MGHHWDKDEFASWVRALAAGELTKEQIDTLDAMVASGEAKSRKDAAERLDWQDKIVDPDEHMHGP